MPADSKVKEKEIAERPVYEHGGYGISYRLWLIGLALQGLSGSHNGSGFTAEIAVNYADAVIARLAAEDKK